MTDLELGVKNFRRRLAFGIRDSVLQQLADPATLARSKAMPESEVGPLADLRSDERAALALVVAHAIDQGIHHFLYGLWNQPDGFELRYRRAHLNAEGEYFLIADTLPEISEESAFDRDGNPKE